ncbi:SDR family oxidoreductase [Streptomyces sp. NPDC021212]|uniref:SDR family oxidoreductase n=1 Tax=Streptomyces sp. NPDC021212 TaxID=3365118 RepID=UPI003795D6A8
MSEILVTGATGSVGRQVVARLLATDTDVRALARDPETAGLPEEVTVLSGDLSEPDTLERASPPTREGGPSRSAPRRSFAAPTSPLQP